MLGGNNMVLSGVYTYSFLGMMLLFGSGCVMLKIKRKDIPRTVVAPWYEPLAGSLTFRLIILECVSLVFFVGGVSGSASV